MSRFWQQQCQSRFFCTKCGKEGISISRKKGSLRESGHLKKLYCIYCQEEVNHAEIRDNGSYTYDDFLEEFKSGRFIEGQREKIGNLFYCSCQDCPFNKNGKCWNANNSSECKHKPKEEEI